MDLNCDLGEQEAPATTRALMRFITSANVACGGHAGDVRSMERCVQLARKFSVRLGAHPGAWSRASFGRERFDMTPDALELLLLQQVSALERIGRDHGVSLHHIKLHGALYHATEQDHRLARHYVRAVHARWPQARIYAQAGGLVARFARRVGVGVWEEAFADRGYAASNRLVPRGAPGALIGAPAEAIRRVQQLLAAGTVVTVTGESISLRPQTICVHSDSPGSPQMARAIRQLLDRQAMH